MQLSICAVAKKEFSIPGFYKFVLANLVSSRINYIFTKLTCLDERLTYLDNLLNIHKMSGPGQYIQPLWARLHRIDSSNFLSPMQSFSNQGYEPSRHLVNAWYTVMELGYAKTNNYINDMIGSIWGRGYWQDDRLLKNRYFREYWRMGDNERAAYTQAIYHNYALVYAKLLGLFFYRDKDIPLQILIDMSSEYDIHLSVFLGEMAVNARMLDVSTLNGLYQLQLEEEYIQSPIGQEYHVPYIRYIDFFYNARKYLGRLPLEANYKVDRKRFPVGIDEMCVNTDDMVTNYGNIVQVSTPSTMSTEIANVIQYLYTQA